MFLDLDLEIEILPGAEAAAAREIALAIMDEYEGRLLRKYISEMFLPPDDNEQVCLLAGELLCPSDEDDETLCGYRAERIDMIAAPVEACLKRHRKIVPRGAYNFLCTAYRCELRAVAAAAAELIAEERHGDLCCLIANEYIEKRKHSLGSKLVAVHLVIDEDSMSLYNADHREITDEYSAYIPPEDRLRYTRSDLVLSAMVDIAPRSIYVYGGENNLKLLRRVQLMFTGVMPQDVEWR